MRSKLSMLTAQRWHNRCVLSLQLFRAGVWFLALTVGGLGIATCAKAQTPLEEFSQETMKSRFEHEIAFRAAAVQVAWGASPLCEDTTQIEPFVLWSVHAVRKRMSDPEKTALKTATGMDDKWRVAWLDEGAPDELNEGDVVVAINGRPLNGATLQFDMSAIWRGSLPIGANDREFWEVLLTAREEARKGVPMSLTLDNGKKLTVETQTGCAGSVIASAFDAEPSAFWRDGIKRVKLPGNALMSAKGRDEFRWLAAFGTYFQASEAAIGRQGKADQVNKGFLLGKVLTLAVPGSGLLLSLVETQTERMIAVDGLSGSADLFANEVVTALGGDPQAALRLNRQMREDQVKADEVVMNDTRYDTSKGHVERLLAIQAEQAKAQGADVK